MNELDIVVKLLLSVVMGGAIGFFREKEGKPAGLRTHTMVAMGSALLMIVSIHVGETFAGADAGRIASAVVTGIGFLGAGAIIQQREKGSVLGLTTAASVWISAAIGLAVGASMYIAATAATLLSLIVIAVFRRIERKYIRRSS